MSDEVATPKKRSKRGELNKQQQQAELPVDEPTQPGFHASLGLCPVDNLPLPAASKASTQPVQLLNARGMPARIRKRNRLFFDDNIINDNKPLRMSLSPKKTPSKASGNIALRTPTKTIKKRKGNPLRFLAGRKRTVEDAEASSSNNNSSPAKTLSPKSVNSSLSSTPKSNKKALKKASKSLMAFSAMHSLQEKTDKRASQTIAMQLRNLLKLPKAHKWVIYEWFYSFIDKPIFEGENDFEICIADLMPGLQTRQLTRMEWRRIRSKIGKPRRCSQAFFDEERGELERKRQRIRYMQTRKTGEIKNLNILRDLPHQIPHFLTVGTKVTARLRVPQDGIFSGQVAAFDSATSIYRITFDRPGLGTHSVPDFEICSESFNEMLPLQSITKDFRPNLMSVLNGAQSGYAYFAGMSPVKGHSAMRSVRNLIASNFNRSDPLLGQEINENPYRDVVVERESLNGYPIKLLEVFKRLQTAAKLKHDKLQRLSEMNNQAERKGTQHLLLVAELEVENKANVSDNASLGIDFQRRYASLVLQLEKLNKDMQGYLNEIQSYNSDLTRDPQVQAMLVPSYLREKCREAAEDALKRNNKQATLQNTNILNLIKKLATVMMVASHLGNENTPQVAKVLEGCMEEVRTNIMPENVETFQKHVQLHLHHIRLGIGQNMMASNANNNANASLNNSTATVDNL